MAKVCLLSLSLSFLLLFNGCIATSTTRQMGTQQQRNECQIHRLNALEPNDRIQAEAGETQFWDSKNQQFQCAGVSVICRRIQPRGLLPPSYINSPLQLPTSSKVMVFRVLCCPVVLKRSNLLNNLHEKGREEEEGGRRGERFQDRHQKIQHFRQGAVVAIPARAAD